MTTVNYYIEDLATGLVVMSNTAPGQYVPGCDAKVFSSNADAVSYIDTLSNSEYRVFSRIVKS